MASETVDYVPTLDERLIYLREAPGSAISTLVDSMSELNNCLPQNYLLELEESDRVICLRAALVCWAVTEGKIIPREMQLRAILADQRSRDSLISAGTGSGKTLPIAICTLLARSDWIDVVRICLNGRLVCKSVVGYWVRTRKDLLAP
jgi:hypothetical protein